MIERIVMELGPWNWMALGLVLLGLEIVVPGIFLLWIGIAAIIVGTLTLMIGGAAFWTWQLQIILFLILSLVSAYIGKKVMAKGDGVSDEPFLNQRAEQLVGRTATLAEPISDGRGRIKLGDTQWRVSGPDLPVGTKVKVVSTDGSELSVERMG
jgi:membrane protein implicated in regulation of membrane protease activity